MSDDRPGCAGYKLTMPFIACQSEGGDYEDYAFVAGWVTATIDSDLRNNRPQGSYQVRPNLVPQLDLVAMNRGFLLVVERGSAFWSVVRFDRVQPI